ncbi:MAG: hypothetical protein PHV62_05905 [Sulfuricurvum sp.]|nr:hypothetical protein [Sulfuricurvum sp.]
MSVERPRTKALRISRIVIDASKSPEPQEVLGRNIDDLTDGIDGNEVVKEFVKLYRTDDAVREAINKVDGWIGIEHWIYQSERDRQIVV